MENIEAGKPSAAIVFVWDKSSDKQEYCIVILVLYSVTV